MPYSGRFDPPANPGSVEPFGLDLWRQLVGGDTIATVSAALTVASGKDPNAASHTGATSIAGNVASVIVSGLVGGVDYILTLTVTTSQGKTLVNWADLPCAAIGR